MKKICFVSTSRSDFNMIQELIKESIKYKRQSSKDKDKNARVPMG